MNYDRALEAEHFIELSNKSKKLFSLTSKTIKLELKNYKGNNRFELWSDSYNTISLEVRRDHCVFQCRFLHESYDVILTPKGIYNAMRDENRGIDHLRAYAKRKEQ